MTFPESNINPNYLLGKVSGYEIREKHVIKFTVPDYIEDGIAYPLDVSDSVEEGDLIILLEVDSIFHSLYFYMKLKLDDYLRFHYKDSSLTITDSEIDLKSDNINLFKNKSLAQRALKGESTNDLLTQINTTFTNLNINLSTIASIVPPVPVTTAQFAPVVAALTNDLAILNSLIQVILSNVVKIE